MADAAQLPRWDLTPIFPGLDSPELREALSSFAFEIDGLSALFDRYGIGVPGSEPLDETPVAAFGDVTGAYNELLALSWRLETYCYAQIAVDSSNAVAQARWGDVSRQAGRLEALKARYSAWLAVLDIDALIERSPAAAAHAGPLRVLADAAQHQMSPEEESLAAELNASGAAAWLRLYERVWSSMTVEVELDGERQSLPMSRVRLLASDPGRETRRLLYEAELRSWRAASLPLAAALNGVKGQALTLAARRGWPSPLDAACADNQIDRATLEVMLGAVREAVPDFRCYLRAKAAALGLEQLAWHDLQAPVGGSGQSWPFEKARDVILRVFAGYSPGLHGLAGRAFNERWLDIEPRAGKQGGGFCSAVGDGTSRIMTNFQPVFGEVRTLAHELGHAYHNHVQQREGRTILQRMLTPPTLAETASKFCETLVRQAALDDASDAEQLTLLDAGLQDQCRSVVDVASAFLFEQRLFAARQSRELSVKEINTLMTAAQHETYGDAIDPATLHPFMWAYRPHYFSATAATPGFAYTFGLLFSLGLFVRYREEPTGFPARFDALLAATGESDPARLAARFEIDLREPEFWRSSLALIRADIDRFARLVVPRQVGRVSQTPPQPPPRGYPA